MLVSLDWSNNNCAIDVKMNGSVLEGKSSFEMLGLTFSSMKSLSPEVALYLYKSSMRSCMEYCYHVWAGASSCYLELLDKLQKPICRTVGPSLAASLEPLGSGKCSDPVHFLKPQGKFFLSFPCILFYIFLTLKIINRV